MRKQEKVQCISNLKGNFLFSPVSGTEKALLKRREKRRKSPCNNKIICIQF